MLAASKFTRTLLGIVQISSTLCIAAASSAGNWYCEVDRRFVSVDQIGFVREIVLPVDVSSMAIEYANGHTIESLDGSVTWIFLNHSLVGAESADGWRMTDTKTKMECLYRRVEPAIDEDLFRRVRQAESDYLSQFFTLRSMTVETPTAEGAVRSDVLQFTNTVEPSSLLGYWIASGNGDEIAIHVIDHARIEGFGPSVGERSSGVQFVNPDGTFAWKLVGADFVGRLAEDWVAIRNQTEGSMRFVVLRRYGPARVPQVLEGLERVNRAVRQAGGGDAKPVALKRKEPHYPFKMKRAGIAGEATVKFVISSNGEVANASVLESTNPGFNEAAVAAIEQWVFLPGVKSGKPVVTLMTQSFAFSISN
jgi:TonB family protein